LQIHTWRVALNPGKALRFASLLAWGLALACASPSPQPRSGSSRAPSDRTAYRLLADGTLHTDSGKAPVGFFVSGRLDGNRFLPEGDIQGNGKLGTEGHPGWMELSDGSFHGDQTGRSPFPPYVKGFMGADGTFRPSSRSVFH